MKNLPRFLFIGLIGLSMWCCKSEVKVETSNEKPAFDQPWAAHYVDSINTQFSALFKAKDSVGLAAYYWPDAELLPSNRETIKGDAILAEWGATVRMGIPEFTFKVTDLRGDGKFMIETGNYEMKDAAGKLFDRGKYIVVHENRDGVWKIIRDIGNTSMTSEK